MSNSVVETDSFCRRRTKIIATIGPATNNEETLEALINAGMNACRLNFSHGTHKTHKEAVEKIRKVSEKLGKPIAIIMDLQGPKIRVGKLKDGKPIKLKKNDLLTITTDPNYIGDQQSMKVSTTYPNLVKDSSVSKCFMIDDGLLQLRVEVKRLGEKYDEVVCRVIVGGELGESKGINLPGCVISAPALTEKDINDIKFALQCKLGPDYVCLSFVRSEQDIIQCRKLMQETANKTLPIIAKIERQEALDRLEEILKEADGIMVARGDLGIETSMYELPIIQKKLIQMSSEMGKIDITATQLLASMTHNPIPTRAEVSDVANAIFDGTDAIMLSNETAVGKYPIKAVQTMVEVAKIADSNFFKFSRFGNQKFFHDSNVLLNTKASALAACSIAKNFSDKIKFIVVMTLSGATAIEVSQHHPEQPIIAITPSKDVYHRLALVWGVYPFWFEKGIITKDSIIEEEVRKFLKEKQIIKNGETIILVSGLNRAFTTGGSNTVQVVTI